ncbi:MAG: VOC family protein [Anaerolineaceae bacterium]|nr:VOC family protein [Anaerolineaceae bacterium]
MYTVTRYPHGSFCWADLSTHGGEAAVDFYSQLMGWQAETQDTIFGTTYTTFSQDGHRIAGLAWLPPEMSEIPSAWNSYVSVDDVDALLPTVTEAGGQIIQPPFDVPEGARIAVIRDPAGAALCLFQARGNVGTTLVNTPGALCWNELYTADPEASRAFYGALLGWDFQDSRDGEDGRPGYVSIYNRGRANGGMLVMDEGMAANVPPMWVPYFSVADVAASTEQVKSLDGKIIMGPQEEGGVGRWLLFFDPQGASCHVVQLDQPEPWLEHRS